MALMGVHEGATHSYAKGQGDAGLIMGCRIDLSQRRSLIDVESSHTVVAFPIIVLEDKIDCGYLR